LKRIALLVLVSFILLFASDWIKLSYCPTKIQLTSHVSSQDRPSLIFAPAAFDLPDRYYLAYQSWETGEAYGGDIFVEVFDLAWNSLKKVRVTSETSYQDSPCLVYDGTYLYVVYISDETGPYNIFVQMYDAGLHFVHKKQITEMYYPQDRPSALLVGEHFYMAYQSWETGEAYGGDIFVEVFDLAWNSLKKVRVTSETSYQDSPSICYANQSIYVAYVSSETGYGDIFVKQYDLYLETELKFRLTAEPCDHDLPSLNTIITETYQGFSLACQSWELGEASNGDIFVSHFDKVFRQHDKIHITRDKYYQDSPSITSETMHRPAYVAYVSNETGNWNIFVSRIEEAQFQYVLTITSTVGGATNPPSGTYIFEEVVAVVVVALPSPSYNFSHWEVNGAIYYGETIMVIMDQNYTLKAIFSRISYPPDKIVIEKVIVPENLTADLVVWRWPELLHTGDVITPYGSDEYVVNGDKWFYWINDCPYAMFAHDTRYVFVDAQTNETQVIVERWPPILNGVELWPTRKEYWNETYWVYSTMSTPSPKPPSTYETTHSGSWMNLSTASTENEHQSLKRALIIEGHDPTGTLKNASELCYNLLVNFGYSHDEILYLTPEQRVHTDKICTKENVSEAIQNVSKTLTSGDSLWAFIFAHGDVEYWNNLTGFIYLANTRTRLYDYELNQSLSQIADGVNITLVSESCYSGSFTDDLWTLRNVKVMITSTDWKSQSYTASKGLDPPELYNGIKPWEWSWNDTNPDDEGGEFSSGLIQGLGELKDAFRAGTITLGELYVKAFKRAKELDAGYRNGDVLKAHYQNNAEKKPNALLNTIFFEGDITHDGKVNILDVCKAAKAYGSKPGKEKWDPEADVDKSGDVTIVDISRISKKYVTVYYTNP